MNILVTGGAGYIGSHTCKELARNNHTPIAVDNLSNGHQSAVRWGPFEKGDILDKARLVEIIKKYRIEAVIHFAAFAYVGESVKNPKIYYQNNVVGSLHLLEAMIEANVNLMVFSSSCATYGDPVRLPMDETHPQNPVNPYGRTKLIVEQMLNDFQQAHGLNTVSLRYFNAAGADEEGELGEEHEPETHLIPLALKACLGLTPELTIFGDDYPTRDGTCVRDYVHVSDLAKAHVLALEKLFSKRLPSKAYNLAIGKGFTVREVVKAAEDVTRHKIPVRTGPRRGGDPAELVSSSVLAAHELGWRPSFVELAPIIETAWNWLRRNKRVF